jgi:hypothetical protein
VKNSGISCKIATVARIFELPSTDLVKRHLTSETSLSRDDLVSLEATRVAHKAKKRLAHIGSRLARLFGTERIHQEKVSGP